jgi:hypothetical protein
MSLLLTSRITIGKYEFYNVGEAEITSTWKSIGDTATLRMYGFADVEKEDGTVGRHVALEEIISVGTPAMIELGYDGELYTEFTGYVAEVKCKVPFELRLEDEFFHLKRQPVNRTWKDVALAELLTELVPTVQLSKTIPQIKLSAFRADRTTVYGVLSKLKEDYLLCAYFRDAKLFVGLPYTEFDSSSAQVPGQEATYVLQQNVVSDDLSYKEKKDVRLKVKVTAKHRNGKTTTIEPVGDPDGEERGFSFPSETTDKAELSKIALSKLDRLKYDGYRGKLTGFGVPFIVHSGTVNLYDDLRPSRNGRYLVDSVRTTFGMQGFRREVELARKVGTL